jgi:hypothetical protein
MSMVDDERRAPMTRVKDGRSWRIGGTDEIDWIAGDTVTGLTITSAIPPIFDAYATMVIPEARNDRGEHDQALLTLLSASSPNQPWWLGYLDTGGDDAVFYDVPMVRLYADWPYMFVEAGPAEAAHWRDASSWRGPLPDVIFPADRSWLLSRLWDDDWRCVGGPADLIERLHGATHLETRLVNLNDDATPPGHVAR